jgi:hypothetical protein
LNFIQTAIVKIKHFRQCCGAGDTKNRIEITGRDARDTFLPDIRLIQKPNTGYSVKAGDRLSGRILDIRPDTWLDNYIFSKILYQINFFFKQLTMIDFGNIKQSMI